MTVPLNNALQQARWRQTNTRASASSTVAPPVPDDLSRDIPKSPARRYIDWSNQ
jgi:hypothetical protein